MEVLYPPSVHIKEGLSYGIVISLSDVEWLDSKEYIAFCSATYNLIIGHAQVGTCGFTTNLNDRWTAAHVPVALLKNKLLPSMICGELLIPFCIEAFYEGIEKVNAAKSLFIVFEQSNYEVILRIKFHSDRKSVQWFDSTLYFK